MTNLAKWTYSVTFILFAFIVLSSCNDSDDESSLQIPAPVYYDLDSIKARGKIILITENGPTTYYQYRGQGRGFDYDLVAAFAKSIGVKLEIRILDDVDKMFAHLNRGEGDIIASNLTITEERKKFVRFSAPVYQTRQMLVQKKMDPLKPDSAIEMLSDTLALKDKNIWVHRYSSFYSRLKEIERNNEFNINIHEAPGEISTEDMIRLTASGEVERTITDENLAILQQLDYPELDMSVPVSNPQSIGWAVRSNAPNLEKAINDWLESKNGKKKVTKTFDKYFKIESYYGYKGPYQLPQLGPGKISPYDSLFKKYAPDIKWDWRLLAALCYQESRFNPEAVSWSGAFGLMQLMPETAARFDCDTSQLIEPNIRAGVKYIQHLERYWKDRIPNPEERRKFVLASYNIGPGHIQDARNIAIVMGKPDTIWDGNVAECLLLKTQEKYYTLDVVKHGYCHAKEPYHFVEKILAVYNHYREKVK
ncbi:MAG: transporter substrate-binding domain-containing protein [Flavobacteriales bacterium]|jgi:membrane-bound lytic murein transglycosylase F